MSFFSAQKDYVSCTRTTVQIDGQLVDVRMFMEPERSAKVPVVTVTLCATFPGVVVRLSDRDIFRAWSESPRNIRKSFRELLI